MDPGINLIIPKYNVIPDNLIKERDEINEAMRNDVQESDCITEQVSLNSDDEECTLDVSGELADYYTPGDMEAEELNIHVVNIRECCTAIAKETYDLEKLDIAKEVFESLQQSLRTLREAHEGRIPVLKPKFRRFHTLAKDTELYRGKEVVRIRNPRKHKPDKSDANKKATCAADQIILDSLQEFSRKSFWCNFHLYE